VPAATASRESLALVGTTANVVTVKLAVPVAMDANVLLLDRR